MEGRTRVDKRGTEDWVIGNYVGSDVVIPVACTKTCTDMTHRGPPYHSGGGLSIVKDETVHTPTSAYSTFWNASQPLIYNGRFVCRLPTLATPVFSDFSGNGVKLWKSALPVHDVAQLATFVGELRDLPHQLRQTKALMKSLIPGPKGVRPSLGETAGHYLNYEFGWAPLVSDLVKFLSLGEKLHKRITWLHRNRGKTIRRHTSMPDFAYSELVSKTTTTWTTLTPVIATFYYKPEVVERIVNRAYLREQWFEGAFTYHVPDFNIKDPPYWLRLQLLGAIPDLATVYNLVPWTWLIDWFTNLGDIVELMVLRWKYSQVAKYAYLMTTQSWTYSTTGEMVFSPRPSSVPFKRIGASSKRTFVTKGRIAANPYGFGVLEGSLNGTQLSILAALGINRLR